MALSREKVLESAVALVDREGLDALTMRRLGGELGVEAMSLYRYVANKSDLLDGVLERIAEEIELPEPSGDWRADSHLAGVRFYEILSDHPHALPLFASRPAVTPATMGILQRALALIAQGGFDPAECLRRFNLVLALVVGYAMTSAEPREAPAVDYAALDSDEFPILSQLAPIVGRTDPREQFGKGLADLLRGFDAIAER